MPEDLISAVELHLARTNRDVLAGQASFAHFAAAWGPLLVAARPAWRPAGEWVSAQGMVRSSMDRHAFVAGIPSAVVAAVAPPDATLVRASAGGPPREVLARYVAGPGFLDVPAEDAVGEPLVGAMARRV